MRHLMQVFITVSTLDARLCQDAIILLYMGKVVQMLYHNWQQNLTDHIRMFRKKVIKSWELLLRIPFGVLRKGKMFL